MYRSVAAGLLLFALSTGPASGPAPAREAGEEVDVELCLAADGSGSISDQEFAFQRTGYAAALAHPRVIGAVQSGLLGRIAVAHMEWGGAHSMEAVVEWRVIADEASALAFGAELVMAPRRTEGWNSISNAILFCLTWIEGNGYDGLRKVIDVSGDAGQHGGVPLPAARQQALDAGIAINALALDFRGGGLSGPGGMALVDHFRADVIGGPGSFALQVDEADEFVAALVHKLVLEIVGPATGPPAAQLR